MPDARRSGGIQVSRARGEGIVHVSIPTEHYTPKRVFYVDYGEVQRGVDGVRLIFGKRDPFAPPEQARLHYVLEVSFPNAQFANQLYQSLQRPAEPGKPLFVDSLKDSLNRNGYSRIDSLVPPRSAEKQGYVRANAALMVVFEDDACVDFVHLDAMSLHLASKGKSITDMGDVLRVVMAPNLLLYFVERIITTAEEMIRETPALAREAAQ